MKWEVVAYDKNNHEIDRWTIHDRNENEARREAEADVQKLGDEVDDWTLTPILGEG